MEINNLNYLSGILLFVIWAIKVKLIIGYFIRPKLMKKLSMLVQHSKPFNSSRFFMKDFTKTGNLIIFVQLDKVYFIRLKYIEFIYEKI